MMSCLLCSSLTPFFFRPVLRDLSRRAMAKEKKVGDQGIRGACPSFPHHPQSLPSQEPRPRRLFEDINVRPYVQAVAALSVALAAMYIYKGVHSQLQFLSVEDSAKLKEVFFGNVTTWAVLCHSNLAQPLFQPFEAAARKLSGQEGLSFGVLDCSAKLPSGRTTIQRFSLNRKIEPVVFIKSPENRKPRQLYPRYMSTADVLIKEVMSVVTPQAVIVRDAKGLKEHCTSEDLCLLVLKGKSFGPKEEKIITTLMKRYGTVSKFAMIDSILHETSLEQRLPRFNPDVNRVVLFSQKDKEPLKAKVYNGEFKEKDLATLLDDAVKGALRMKKVDSAIDVFKRSSASSRAGGSASGNARSAEKRSERTAPPSTEGGDASGLSKEDEARLQAQREAAIREAMDKESADFISLADDDEEDDEETTSGSGTTGQEEEEDEDVVDLDEI